MRVRHSFRWAAALLLVVVAPSHAQQPRIGVPVPPLGEGPWVVDTAEQHRIRVSVVTKGPVPTAFPPLRPPLPGANPR